MRCDMIHYRIVLRVCKIKNRQNKGIGSIVNTATFSFMPSETPSITVQILPLIFDCDGMLLNQEDLMNILSASKSAIRTV